MPTVQDIYNSLKENPDYLSLGDGDVKREAIRRARQHANNEKALSMAIQNSAMGKLLSFVAKADEDEEDDGGKIGDYIFKVTQWLTEGDQKAFLNAKELAYVDPMGFRWNRFEDYSNALADYITEWGGKFQWDFGEGTSESESPGFIMPVRATGADPGTVTGRREINEEKSIRADKATAWDDAIGSYIRENGIAENSNKLAEVFNHLAAKSAYDYTSQLYANQQDGIADRDIEGTATQKKTFKDFVAQLVNLSSLNTVRNGLFPIDDLPENAPIISSFFGDDGRFTNIQQQQEREERARQDQAGGASGSGADVRSPSSTYIDQAKYDEIMASKTQLIQAINSDDTEFLGSGLLREADNLPEGNPLKDEGKLLSGLWVQLNGAFGVLADNYAAAQRGGGRIELPPGFMNTFFGENPGVDDDNKPVGIFVKTTDEHNNSTYSLNPHWANKASEWRNNMSTTPPTLRDLNTKHLALIREGDSPIDIFRMISPLDYQEDDDRWDKYYISARGRKFLKDPTGDGQKPLITNERLTSPRGTPWTPDWTEEGKKYDEVLKGIHKFDTPKIGNTPSLTSLVRNAMLQHLFDLDQRGKFPTADQINNLTIEAEHGAWNAARDVLDVNYSTEESSDRPLPGPRIVNTGSFTDPNSVDHFIKHYVPHEINGEIAKMLEPKEMDGTSFNPIEEMTGWGEDAHVKVQEQFDKLKTIFTDISDELYRGKGSLPEAPLIGTGRNVRAIHDKVAFTDDQKLRYNELNTNRAIVEAWLKTFSNTLVGEGTNNWENHIWPDGSPARDGAWDWYQTLESMKSFPERGQEPDIAETTDGEPSHDSNGNPNFVAIPSKHSGKFGYNTDWSHLRNFRESFGELGKEDGSPWGKVIPNTDDMVKDWLAQSDQLGEDWVKDHFNTAWREWRETFPADKKTGKTWPWEDWQLQIREQVRGAKREGMTRNTMTHYPGQFLKWLGIGEDAFADVDGNLRYATYQQGGNYSRRPPEETSGGAGTADGDEDQVPGDGSAGDAGGDEVGDDEVGDDEVGDDEVGDDEVGGGDGNGDGNGGEEERSGDEGNVGTGTWQWADNPNKPLEGDYTWKPGIGGEEEVIPPKPTEPPPEIIDRNKKIKDILAQEYGEDWANNPHASDDIEQLIHHAKNDKLRDEWNKRVLQVRQKERGETKKTETSRTKGEEGKLTSENRDKLLREYLEVYNEIHHREPDPREMERLKTEPDKNLQDAHKRMLANGEQNRQQVDKKIKQDRANKVAQYFKPLDQEHLTPDDIQMRVRKLINHQRLYGDLMGAEASKVYEERLAEAHQLADAAQMDLPLLEQKDLKEAEERGEDYGSTDWLERIGGDHADLMERRDAHKNAVGMGGELRTNVNYKPWLTVRYNDDDTSYFHDFESGEGVDQHALEFDDDNHYHFHGLDPDMVKDVLRYNKLKASRGEQPGQLPSPFDSDTKPPDEELTTLEKKVLQPEYKDIRERVDISGELPNAQSLFYDKFMHMRDRRPKAENGGAEDVPQFYRDAKDRRGVRGWYHPESESWINPYRHKELMDDMGGQYGAGRYVMQGTQFVGNNNPAESRYAFAVPSQAKSAKLKNIKEGIGDQTYYVDHTGAIAHAQDSFESSNASSHEQPQTVNGVIHDWYAQQIGNQIKANPSAFRDEQGKVRQVGNVDAPIAPPIQAMWLELAEALGREEGSALARRRVKYEANKPSRFEQFRSKVQHPLSEVARDPLSRQELGQTREWSGVREAKQVYFDVIDKLPVGGLVSWGLKLAGQLDKPEDKVIRRIRQGYQQQAETEKLVRESARRTTINGKPLSDIYVAPGEQKARTEDYLELKRHLEHNLKYHHNAGREADQRKDTSAKAHHTAQHIKYQRSSNTLKALDSAIPPQWKDINSIYDEYLGRVNQAPASDDSFKEWGLRMAQPPRQRLIGTGSQSTKPLPSPFDIHPSSRESLPSPYEGEERQDNQKVQKLPSPFGFGEKQRDNRELPKLPSPFVV